MRCASERSISRFFLHPGGLPRFVSLRLQAMRRAPDVFMTLLKISTSRSSRHPVLQPSGVSAIRCFSHPVFQPSGASPGHLVYPMPSVFAIRPLAFQPSGAFSVPVVISVLVIRCSSLPVISSFGASAFRLSRYPVFQPSVIRLTGFQPSGFLPGASAFRSSRHSVLQPSGFSASSHPVFQPSVPASAVSAIRPSSLPVLQPSGHPPFHPSGFQPPAVSAFWLPASR